MSETDAENVWVVLMEKERYSSTTYGAPKLKKLAKITPKLLFTKARWGMNSIEKGRAVWKLFDDEADARAFYDELMERTRWMEIHDEVVDLQKRVQECCERQAAYATREATNHDHGWYFLPDEA